MSSIAFAALLLAGCATIPADATRARYLMGTTCTVTVPAGEEADAQAALDEIARVEQFLTTWRDDSELARLNAAADDVAVDVSPELFALLDEVSSLAETTGGAFNPLVRPLVDLWNTRGEGSVPAQSALEAALARTNPALARLDRAHSTVALSRGAAFEEGGFGKGYALDRALAVLAQNGVGRAFVDFGGQVSLFGWSRGLDVAIAHPEQRLEPAVVVTVESGSIATSSGSERTFVVDGARFSHLIDPRNGRALPPRGSATAFDARGLVADVLSTALCVLGPDEGLRWADAHDVAALFIVPNPVSDAWEVRTSRSFRSHVRAIRLVAPNLTVKDQ
ncbi:MAG: FAD:protein FMN transferase [Thermoanaerobaculia bacterium]